MNIEIANRLQKLRKEKGYSQEELADALGISRQAVSKWERAEASPDTDNLICLAKLYGVSLDDLLDTDETVDEIKEEQKEKAEESKINNDEEGFTARDGGDYVHFGPGGIHVKDEDGSEVHIDFRGIHAKDSDGSKIHINGKTINANDSNGRKVVVNPRKIKMSSYLEGTLFLLATVGYILMGALLDCWYSAWVLFFVPEIVCSTLRVIEKKKLGEFNICFLACYVFFTVCLAHSVGHELWHPMWVVFLSIPIYYTLVEPFDKRHKHEFFGYEDYETVDKGTVDATEDD